MSRKCTRNGVSMETFLTGKLSESSVFYRVRTVKASQRSLLYCFISTLSLLGPFVPNKPINVCLPIILFLGFDLDLLLISELQYPCKSHVSIYVCGYMVYF